ncbi:ABC transporter ATP-binding protein [Microbacterium sp. No. 7]|uniref:ABC transporter ATP-binding protein n=1 Tax=Microbacterium sp. No. 7 TaxID=1714373 RepID=UPI0006D252BD|nr:ABC transporter ATP-binding protein [Microbacterium sp. No. 7]ALJ19930.1 branched-chain amino acid ABC transporter ATP-binding protein [Microbacterium sp. No. 7]
MTLAVHNVEVVYEDVMLVVKGASIRVPRDGIVALLGANGAGKTSLLRAMTGLLDVHRGRISRGHISIDDAPLDTRRAADVVRAGVSQVMEGRRVFVEFTVEENLRVGAYTRPTAANAEKLERIYAMFPILKERRGQRAGYLSGGEQQMLAIGRALMAEPRYILLDEPSLGLAPQVVERIRDLIVEIRRSGTGVLLVEQNAAMALSIADHGYVMENGKIVMDAPAQALRDDDDIREFYLGTGASVASLRDVKHYKRRKRWLS